MEEKKERKSWRDIVSSRNPDLDLEDDLAVGEFLMTLSNVMTIVNHRERTSTKFLQKTLEPPAS